MKKIVTPAAKTPAPAPKVEKTPKPVAKKVDVIVKKSAVVAAAPVKAKVTKTVVPAPVPAVTKAAAPAPVPAVTKTVAPAPAPARAPVPVVAAPVPTPAKAKVTKATPVAKPAVAPAAKPAKPVIRVAAPAAVVAPAPAPTPASVAPSAPSVAAPVVVAAPVIAAVEVKAPAASTMIVAAVDIGFGNVLTLRGEGAGLSWDTGVALLCAAEDRWSINLPASTEPVVFKFLINDTVWSTGDNFSVLSGASVVLSPSF